MQTIFRLLLICLLCWGPSVVVAAKTRATTNANNVTEYNLNNGLKVLFKVDKRSPAAFVSLWYNVGSADEVNGKTGLAHLLEHLLFRGSKKFPGDSYSQKIAAAGGEFNAFTSSDQTVYYASVPSKSIKLVLQLEADRMRNINFSNKDFKHEQQVVIEEWRMRIADNPHGLARTRFYAAAHLSNPYHHPVIGWLGDIKTETAQDARAFYKKYYTPQNATLIIVGNFKPRQLKKTINRYFGRIKKSKLPQRAQKNEQKNLGLREVLLHGKVSQPWIKIGFNTDNYANLKNKANVYATMVLAGVLKSGNSGLLPEQLQHKHNLAAHISVGYDPFTRYNTLFSITATGLPQVKPYTLRHLIWKQLKSLRDKPVPDSTLQSIKIQVLAAHVFAQDSLRAQAMWLGMLASNGYPWQLADKLVANINKVTAKDVQQAAKRLFVRNNAVITTLLPNNIKHGGLHANP